MGDLTLARRLLAGDEAAFEVFFADYFPRLFRFALVRLGGDVDAAEEVAEAAIVRAIRKLDSYRGEAAMFTWLCAFCRREISAWLHLSGRTPSVLPIDDRPEIRAALEAVAAGTGEDPESILRRQELSRLVQATLDHLPAHYGNALEWRYIDGLTVEQIAQRLGLGYKATESVLSRARQAFRVGYLQVARG
jgi:RNA polymerase sigma-70 factor (ECF subfamily)